ncbi:uncharacterized protein BO66DRAFT_144607 [Aspergillus aculeatinus CBS 121060]|uniref:Uncharacterized protein n=1 Tax=Aspergillus aculeatinus CBS 121060 TaxID=1448322 RepID=A0ACD1HLA3_9EURO|nr:hypothetical protein BO66DRAFT_144607 [Aspergillus aculeatinus CBS 121060]RAH74221.1 hypothetical protein BO66DRAFT_144607 [Aspergillus aculeatinus CBS 121060]
MTDSNFRRRSIPSCLVFCQGTIFFVLDGWTRFWVAWVMRDNSTCHQIESSGGTGWEISIRGPWYQEFFSSQNNGGVRESTTAVAQWVPGSVRRRDETKTTSTMSACLRFSPGLEFLQDATAGRGWREELEDSIMIGILGCSHL